MHKRLFILLYISVLLVFVACEKDASNNTENNIEITVQGSAEIPLVSADFINDDSDSAPVKDIKEGRISDILSLLPNDYVLLEDVTVSLESNNVESSEVDERVILFANKDNLNVKVMIASYDKVTRRYNFIWQADTTSYGIDTGAQLEVKDITQDYSKEIIVLGVNQDNKNVIDVFQRPANQPIQSYYNIFSKQADSIDVIELNKPQFTSSELESIGNEYQIITLNILSDGIFFREYYKWAQNAIVKILEESFSQQDVTQQKLMSLRQASDEDFQKFLTGGWVKSSDDDDNSQSDWKNKLGIIFQDKTDNVFFFINNQRTSDEAYWYSWQSSFRNMSRRGGIGLRVSIKSNILPAVYDWAQLDIISENKIYVTVKDTVPKIMEGEYTRIANYADLSNFVFQHSRVSFHSMTENIMKNIAGLYKNTSETEKDELFLFDYPYVKIINNDVEKNAMYTISEVNGLSILELKVEHEAPVFYLVGIKGEEDYSSIDLLPLSLYVKSIYKNRYLKRLILEKEVN